MKKNEFVQIKGLALKELIGQAKSIEKEIVNLVLDKNMKKLKDVKSISKKRKDLAKILTVIRQKELLVQLESISHQSSEVSLQTEKETNEKEEKPKKLNKRKESLTAED